MLDPREIRIDSSSLSDTHLKVFKRMVHMPTGIYVEGTFDATKDGSYHKWNQAMLKELEDKINVR
jgi:hypothetical protein